MLARTAQNLFWLSRYMERAQNMARLVEVAYRMAMTPSVAQGHREEWRSALSSAGCEAGYDERYGDLQPARVIDWMLLDRDNSSSVYACLQAARTNARAVRTAITREMWEAVNGTWLELEERTRAGLSHNGLPDFLQWVRQRAALFRGTLMGTILRNDGFFFSQTGAFLERADNTARILDVKYYLLLPRNVAVGGGIDRLQWSTILRSVSAHRAYLWVYSRGYNATDVAEFLILRPEMPRSLLHCHAEVDDALADLAAYYDTGPGAAQALAAENHQLLREQTLDQILLDTGLHEFLGDMIDRVSRLTDQIAGDYF